ncbi:hypothetical protein [Kitasatospora sp. KL5]|uniref:hypothetical protein n=1 Tax=Kitasatospora sp. KL5 TaxID=3425125 RepID=UPI003D6E92AC
MLVETIAYTLIGLSVGAGVLLALPEYFPASRTLTASTAVIAALLSGLVSRYVLAEQEPGASLAVSAVCSALLVSVLARPDLVDRTAPRRARHHRHA